MKLDDHTLESDKISEKSYPGGLGDFYRLYFPTPEMSPKQCCVSPIDCFCGLTKEYRKEVPRKSLTLPY